MSSYRRDLVAYEAYLAQRSPSLRPEVATSAEVAAYIVALRATHSAASVARALSAVRGLHRFLVEEHLAAVDPTADLPGIALADLLPKALSEDEVSRLLGVVVGTGPSVLRDRALLEILYGTGARVSEVVGLNLGDVAEAIESDTTALIRVLGKRIQRAGGPARLLAKAALSEWLSGAGRVHFAPKRWQQRVPTPKRSSSTCEAVGSAGSGPLGS